MFLYGQHQTQRQHLQAATQRWNKIVTVLCGQHKVSVWIYIPPTVVWTRACACACAREHVTVSPWALWLCACACARESVVVRSCVNPWTRGCALVRAPVKTVKTVCEHVHVPVSPWLCARACARENCLWTCACIREPVVVRSCVLPWKLYVNPCALVTCTCACTRACAYVCDCVRGLDIHTGAPSSGYSTLKQSNDVVLWSAPSVPSSGDSTLKQNRFVASAKCTFKQSLNVETKWWRYSKPSFQSNHSILTGPHTQLSNYHVPANP